MTSNYAGYRGLIQRKNFIAHTKRNALMEPTINCNKYNDNKYQLSPQGVVQTTKARPLHGHIWDHKLKIRIVSGKADVMIKNPEQKL